MRRLFVPALRAFRACVVAVPRSYDRGYLLPALRAWAAVIALIASGSAWAQEAAGDKAPAFTATLLRIKADWSASPVAKEIEADLKNALRGEEKSEEVLQKFPTMGAEIIFAPAAGAVYTKEHYAQLLAWLKAKELVLESEPFEATKPATGLTVGSMAVLSKDPAFVQDESRRANSDLFFTRSARFTWTVLAMPGQFDWSVQRELRNYEQARGQDEPKPANNGEYDRCAYQVPALADGHVLIARAFPAVTDDREYQTVEKEKGWLTLVVIEKGAVRSEPAVEGRLLLPEKVERTNAKRQRGITSGLGWAPATAAMAAQKTRYVTDTNLMINWSEGLDTAWGFSKSLGKWAKQELKPAAKETRGLLVDGNIAVWRIDSSYYAFSSETGNWDVLRLESGHSPPQFLDSGFARIHDGDEVYTFASATGRWSSPKNVENDQVSNKTSDLDAKKREIEGQLNAAKESLNAVALELQNPDLHSAEDRKRLEGEQAKLRVQVSSLGKQFDLIKERLTDETQIKVFALRNTKATDAERLINQLFARKIRSVAADERTNSLVVSGPSDDLNIIYHILTRLDEPLESEKQWADTKASARAKGATGEAAAGESIATLTKLYESHEEQAAALAREIRTLQSAKSTDQRQLDKLSAALRNAVSRAFAARQQLHQAEAAQLQQRLASVQNNLKTRERLSEEIVDRRVNDLLDPDAQWPVPAKESPNAARANAPKQQTATAPEEELHGLKPPPSSSVLGSVHAIIAGVLGVEVELVSFDEAGFGAGFLVNKVSSGREAGDSGLRVGDIIVGINQWQTYSEAMLAWTLLQPADKRLLRLNGKERATRETVPIHLVRDREFTTINVELQPWSPHKPFSREESPNAFQERAELFARLHDDPKWIDNAKDDFKRATTDEERRSARDVELSWRRDIVKALLRLRELGEQVEAKLSAAEAELQQAETSPPDLKPTQIDASGATQSPNSPPRLAMPNATEKVVVGIGGQTISLRSPDDFRKNLRSLESAVANIKSPTTLMRFGGKDEKEQRQTQQKMLENAERNLAFAREEYAAQIRLLQLDAQDARSAFDSASQQHHLAQKQFTSGTTSRETVLTFERAVEEARLRLERADTLLDIYRKADPKQPVPKAVRPT